MTQNRSLKFTVSVIIPTLNEVEAIEEVVRSVPRSLSPPTQIMVIDGCSNDGTAERAKAAGAEVIAEEQSGYGGAVLTGLRYAKGNVIVLTDGDGTYSLQDIPKLIQPITEGQADIVIGSRFLGKMQDGAMPLVNRIGNRILTWIYNLLYNENITDTQSGLRAFKRELFKDLTKYNPDFTFLQTVLIEASKEGKRIAEIPTCYRPRKGNSKLNPLKDGYKILSVIIRSKFTN